MHDTDGRLLDDQRTREVIEPHGELSEADLECVVGGLARPWTEAEAAVDGLAEPALSLL
jgi:hypothetical protein